LVVVHTVYIHVYNMHIYMYL